MAEAWRQCLIRFLRQRLGMWRLLVLCVAVGVVAGVGAIIFYTMLDAAKHLFLDYAAGYHPAGPGGEPSLFGASHEPFRRWVLFLVPALGGLLSGALVYRFAPEAEGHGTDAAIDAYLHRGGAVRARVPFIKALTAAITIGSGGSGGREGPIAQIGAGFGSTLARWLRLSARERRTLMAAGMGAGIGAIFHAPLAGGLFAAEVMYKDMDLEYEVLIPAIIASIIAYAVFASCFGWDSLFVTPSFVFEDPLELLPYLALAIVVAGGAIAYVVTFYGVRDLFRKLRLPRFLKPALGGLIVGAIGLFVPEALGTGYGVVQKALTHGTDLAATFGTIGAGALLIIAVAKILTTSFSIASGGSGGVFGPAMVIGGALGGAVGLVAARLFPGLALQPGAFAVVGMAGFFAAAANTPISTIIIVSEMTGNYHLLVPSMWVCIIAYLLARRFCIYENQAQNRFEATLHRGDMMEAILRNIPVRDVLAARAGEPVETLTPAAAFSEVLARFANARQSSFPVVAADGTLIGIVDGRNLRQLITQQQDLGRLLIAEDLADAPVTIDLYDTLLTAVQRMAVNDLDEIAVVDAGAAHGQGRVQGMLSHSDIVLAYQRHLVDAIGQEPAA